MSINADLLQWFVNFFDKKSPGGGAKSENKLNQQLAQESYK